MSKSKSKVYLLDYLRSPFGCFLGNFADLTASQLGEQVLTQLLEKQPVDLTDKIDTSFIGNVINAGHGQNLARQITLNSKVNCPSITLNRVCSSGMESIVQACRMIKLNEANCVIAGGVESMTNAPFLGKELRKGHKYGDFKMLDSLLLDGLTDPFSQRHMGEIAEDVAEKNQITREQQDEYTIQSYHNAKKVDNHIAPITIKNRKDLKIIDQDEQINKLNPEKLVKLKPVFRSNGTITAGNASALSDGASMMLIVSEEFVKQHHLEPLAEIIDYHQISGKPEEFPELPVSSIEKILQKNNLTCDEIEFFEVNEAFSLVPILVNQKLKIDYQKINQLGGGVSTGHPIGCSGNKIVGSLLTLLNQNNLGCASICNGGGGATSLLLRRL